MDSFKVRVSQENNMQELWERTGRMYAAMDYIKNEKCPDVNIIYIMLGGDLNDLSR